MDQVTEILRHVAMLEINTRRLVEGLVAGGYHSVFRGRGLEFSEVREYVPGDDVRSIDWNVTARMNEPFVKEYIEERDLNLYIVFDASGSNDYGSVESKKETAQKIAASLMLAAVRNSDNVGLAISTDTIEEFFSARKGKKHALRLIREIIYYSPKSRNTDIASSIRLLGNALKKRSIIFIISDFISEDFTRQLKALRNRHDVVLVRIIDANERNLPDIGYAYIEDGESGDQILVNTSDEDIRKAFEHEFVNRERSLELLMKRLRIDMISLESGQGFSRPLRKFFRERERRFEHGS